jgi:amidase
MTGPDLKIPTLRSQNGAGGDSVGSDGLKGARVGVARNLFGADSRADRIIDEAINVIRQPGAEIVIRLPSRSHLSYATARAVAPYEFKEDLNPYRRALPAHRVRSLADLIAFNIANENATMPFFGQERLIESEGMGPLTSKEYLSALATCESLARAAIDVPLKEHRLDAIVAPRILPPV